MYVYIHRGELIYKNTVSKKQETKYLATLRTSFFFFNLRTSFIFHICCRQQLRNSDVVLINMYEV